MLFFYAAGIRMYVLLIRLFSLFNPKAKLWLEGRKGGVKALSSRVKRGEKHVWFHFASLGEFEQGRPVIEELKRRFPGKRILITFFSPSGYTVRKNYALADHVFYLPVDTPRNAGEFISLIDPEMAIFTKYDYWYYYFRELHARGIPLYIVSAIFAKNYSFFRWYGGWSRKMLRMVTRFFVQDENSRELLATIGITNVTVTGDTRFDRVVQNAGHPLDLPLIEAFCGTAKVLVAGSTWPADEALLPGMMAGLPGWKLIVAPHELNADRISSLEAKLPGALRYSSLAGAIEEPYPDVLIIDNIGILSSVYRYGQLAYIGGGFGAGIHNTLEAAAYGLPVLFGPAYGKFKEARDLVAQGAAFSATDAASMEKITEQMADDDFRAAAARIARTYVRENVGATEKIMREMLG